MKRVVLLVMKSPRFLYREIGDGRRVRRGCAAVVRDVGFDSRMRSSESGGRGQAGDARARCGSRPGGWWTTCGRESKMREFLMQWLKVDQIPELAKDPALFPDFDEEVASDLRTSLDLFLEDVVWGSEGSDYRELMLVGRAVPERAAGEAYGAELPEDAGFQKVKVEEGRAGGGADASLPDVVLRLHGDEFADSSRGVSGA